MSDKTEPPPAPAIDAAGSSSVVGHAPTVKIHAPLPDDHPFCALVGRVTSEWAHLEHTIDRLIRDLSGTGPIAGGATSRFDALIALATGKGVDEKIVGEIRDIMMKTHDLQEKRNRLSHDPWYIDTGSQQPGQFRNDSKKRRQYGIRDVDEADVLETIERIRRQKEAVSKLWNKISAAPET